MKVTFTVFLGLENCVGQILRCPLNLLCMHQAVDTDFCSLDFFPSTCFHRKVMKFTYDFCAIKVFVALSPTISLHILHVIA